jgi:hypothetical protein
MSRVAFGGGVLLAVVLHAAVILGAEKEPADANEPPEWDLSNFPKFDGKVVQVLGGFNGYIDPIVGTEIHLDFKFVSELKTIPFKPLPGDFADEYYIPLTISDKNDATGSSVVNPLVVDYIKTYTNGAFSHMRLISRSEGQTSPSVKVDIIAGPGAKGAPNPATIWITYERDVFGGVALIEGQFDRPIPNEKAANFQAEMTPDPAKPIASALQFIRERKLDLSRHDAERAAASRYCPPQSTVYQWCVNIPARPDCDVDTIWIAVPAKGSPWRLDPKTLEKLPD